MLVFVNAGRHSLCDGYSGGVNPASSFPRSRLAFSPLHVVESTGSTNADVLASVDEPDAWPQFSALVTLDQRSGRGRRGRTWVAEPGASIAVSIVLRPAESGIPVSETGAVPLVVGLALWDALDDLVPGAVSVKWPNDVLINGAKVAGILCELSPGGAVVAGIGINLRPQPGALEAAGVDQAGVTSIDVEAGVASSADAVVARVASAVRARWGTFAANGGEWEGSGLASAYLAVCDTVGRSVTVTQAGASTISGECVGIDSRGQLLVESDDGLTSFASGEVVHVRRAE